MTEADNGDNDLKFEGFDFAPLVQVATSSEDCFDTFEECKQHEAVHSRSSLLIP